VSLKLELPGGEVPLAAGQSVAEALQGAGVDFETPCAGAGMCGQCLVLVQNHAGVSVTPHETISDADTARGVRLACQLRPDRDLAIRLLERPESGPILAAPAAALTPPHLAPAARVDPDRRLLVYESESIPLPSWDEGWSERGLAVDLGTTTLVVTLVCLRSGRSLATASALNPQTRLGHDVMTRIGRGSSPEGLVELTDAVRQGLSRLTDEVCRRDGCDPGAVVDVAVGGNTTMLQLAAGIDPSPLGRAPFTVDIAGGAVYPASKLGLPVNPGARLYLPPVAHAFFGSDISAGLAVCEGFFDGDRPRLFVDLGTNGELALATGEGRWLYTSTAAGPAFEGMGLSSGLRACQGAVEAARVVDGELRLRTIGGAPVAGICGSGVIDLVACLLEAGVVDHRGRLRHPDDVAGVPPAVAARLGERDGQRAVRLADRVWLTQNDVRQVQLAKGAVRAAIDIFLDATGTAPESIEELVIAGAFGRSLRPGSLEAIGMVPAGLAPRLRFAGNASVRGCVRLLQDASQRRLIERRAARMEHLSLAEHPDFARLYVERMHFPRG